MAAEGVQGSPVLRTPHDDRFVFAASQEVRAAPELRARYCACSTCADVRGPMAVQCAVPRRERTLVLLECAELAPPFEIVHQHPLILRDESGGGSAADARDRVGGLGRTVPVDTSVRPLDASAFTQLRHGQRRGQPAAAAQGARVWGAGGGEEGTGRIPGVRRVGEASAAHERRGGALRRPQPSDRALQCVAAAGVAAAAGRGRWGAHRRSGSDLKTHQPALVAADDKVHPAHE